MAPLRPAFCGAWVNDARLRPVIVRAAAFSSNRSPLQSNCFESAAAFPFSARIASHGRRLLGCVVCCAAGTRLHDREAANPRAVCPRAGATHSNRSGLSTEEHRQPAVERSRDSIAGAAAVSLWRTSRDLGRRSTRDCNFSGQSQKLCRQFFAGVGSFGAPHAPYFLRICTGRDGRNSFEFCE